MTPCPHCGSEHDAENHFCPVSGRAIDLGPRLISLNLLEQFRVVAVLGEGPIGIVVEVEDIRTNKHCAAKLIHPQYTRDATAAQQVLDIALKAGTLACPHIARVLAVGRDAGAALTIVRELMTGQSLKTYLEANGQLPFDRAIDITRQILVAIDAAHQAGIVNLDLSPSDVFLATQGSKETVKLVDIGEYPIKRALIGNDEVPVESSRYYAPEQFDASTHANPKSDLFAAGALLYQMVTGSAPSGKPENIADLRSDISAELATVIRQALAATPHTRFASAEDFISALDAIGKVPDGDSASPDAVGGASAGTETSSSAVPTDAPERTSSTSMKPPQTEAQPSVIVDMPEMEKRFPFLYTPAFRIGAVIVLLAILGFIIYGMTSGDATTEPSEQVEMITIKVAVDPKSAIIFVDGQRVQGNPLTLDVPKDGRPHSIRAKAQGYETVERDIDFDETKSIALSLIEIIKPDEDRTPLRKYESWEASKTSKSGTLPGDNEPGEKVPTSREKTAAAQAADEKSGKMLKSTQKPKAAKSPRQPGKRSSKSRSSKRRTQEKTRDGFSKTNPFG
ncbi:MAG: serine/threonine-protein kinase [Myxococcota bacterium]|nr:serine/threonine-protein kinase [Myxococcota bacterium]